MDIVTSPRRRRRTAVGATIVAVMLGGACGASDETTGDAAPERAARPASIEVAVPDLPVHDLQAGAEIPLRSILGGEQPILLWFWAPH